MKKRLLLTLVVLMGLTSAMATDEITSSNFSISRGETKTFSIQLSNEATNYVGFQMDLTLPEGLTVNKASCSLSDRITDEDQELTIGKQSENTYRLTSTSLSLTSISGTSGDLITISVTASNTYQSGNATISNIQFATSTSERVTMDDVAISINFAVISFADANVKALCVANWDTNDDGELDMAEAATATNLGSIFRSNSDITSFDELQFFTGLTSIGDVAFSNCTGLTSITIPNSVTSIGTSAFYGCSDLSSIAIPNSVTSMGNAVFAGCSGLTSITVDPENTVFDSRNNCNAIIGTAVNSLLVGCQNTVIPNSVTRIGNFAFSGRSSLTSITIPNCITSIGQEAFYGCSGLTSISIPNGVTSIGQNAFKGCSGLISITVDNENTVYDSRNNCNAIIEKETNTLIAGCQNTVIPNSVTSIGVNAFFECSGLTSLILPNSLTSISNYAFSNCSGLTSLILPNSLTSIGSGAFFGCFGLTSITIPEGVTSIEHYAFRECFNLTSITLPNSVTSINNNAFDWCERLTSVVVNMSSPLTISGTTFINRTNATLYVPYGCKDAYEAANYWKEFKEIVEMPSPTIEFVDANVKALCVANWDTNGDGELDMAEAAAVTKLELVFNHSRHIISFNELQYFTGLKSIGNAAFTGCTGLSSITIPNSATSIGYRAFMNCSGLTSITIPNSITTIDQEAFNYCSGLTSITVDTDNTVFDSRNNCNAIIGTAENSLLVGCRNTVIPNNVTRIGNFAFYSRSNLTSITIPNSVTSIGQEAFSFCSGLTSITIPESVTDIGGSAFYGCSGLTSITIPKHVTSIGQEAFNYCTGLTSITVNNENTVYDSRGNCNAIIEKTTNTLIQGCQNTVIPNGVTSIGDWAFYDCSAFTSIKIPNSVISIGSSAFYGCSRLISITLSNSLASIGTQAFYGCSSLTSITFPNTLTSIGDYAFTFSDLTLITLPNSLTSIGDYAFRNAHIKSVVVNKSSPLTISGATFENRSTITLYVPKGSKAAYTAANYWNDFKAIKEFPDPDVNQDGYVDVVDVVDVARFVVGTPSESFDQFLADLNESGEVNVADAVVLVNEIAGDVDWSRSLRAAAVSNDILTLTRNADQSLSFSLEDNSAYTAFQFDLMMPEGMDVTQMALNSLRKQSHKLLFNKIGEGHYRIVALSTSNKSFNGTAGELLNMSFNSQPTDDIVIDNIHFVTTQGNDLQFSAIGISGDTPTSISGVRNNATNSDSKIYNLNGQRLTKTQKGLYIINGHKVLVK